ncbi:MAG: hypothetical protein FJ296_02135 [Planctomycetes bacterium]|nr:hypothetical protein [Planctomycetota bacterium]
MASLDKRIDAYIAASADFARSILVRLREVVHAGCPQVVETIKWRMPAFEHKGPLAGMAAFKQHAVFGFWKHELVVGEDSKAREAMGSFGCLKSLADLPAKKDLVAYVRRAVALNEAGVQAPRRKTRPKKAVAVHPDLRAALARNAKARAAFDGFPPSAKAEYVEWVADAKKDDTRARRVKQAVECMAQGKRRNWKYETC